MFTLALRVVLPFLAVSSCWATVVTSSATAYQVYPDGRREVCEHPTRCALTVPPAPFPSVISRVGVLASGQDGFNAQAGFNYYVEVEARAGGYQSSATATGSAETNGLFVITGGSGVVVMRYDRTSSTNYFMGGRPEVFVSLPPSGVEILYDLVFPITVRASASATATARPVVPPYSYETEASDATAFVRVDNFRFFDLSGNPLTNARLIMLPEPPATALTGLALGALIWWRRRL